MKNANSLREPIEGFEPTRPKDPVYKTGAIDHYAILACNLRMVSKSIDPMYSISSSIIVLILRRVWGSNPRTCYSLTV